MTLNAYKKVSGKYRDTRENPTKLYMPGDIKIVDTNNPKHYPIPEAFMNQWEQVPVPQEYLEKHYERLKNEQLAEIEAQKSLAQITVPKDDISEDITMYIKQPAGRSGWYNIVNVETGEAENDSPLKLEDANAYLEKLNK